MRKGLRSFKACTIGAAVCLSLALGLVACNDDSVSVDNSASSPMSEADSAALADSLARIDSLESGAYCSALGRFFTVTKGDSVEYFQCAGGYRYERRQTAGPQIGCSASNAYTYAEVTDTVRVGDSIAVVSETYLCAAFLWNLGDYYDEIHCSDSAVKVEWVPNPKYGVAVYYRCENGGWEEISKVSYFCDYNGYQVGDTCTFNNSAGIGFIDHNDRGLSAYVLTANGWENITIPDGVVEEYGECNAEGDSLKRVAYDKKEYICQNGEWQYHGDIKLVSAEMGYCTKEREGEEFCVDKGEFFDDIDSTYYRMRYLYRCESLFWNYDPEGDGCTPTVVDTTDVGTDSSSVDNEGV